MLNGDEDTSPAVAVIVISPTAVLNADPELVTVVVAPVVVESWTLELPAVTLQVVDDPPDEVRVIEVA